MVEAINQSKKPYLQTCPLPEGINYFRIVGTDSNNNCLAIGGSINPGILSKINPDKCQTQRQSGECPKFPQQN